MHFPLSAALYQFVDLIHDFFAPHPVGNTVKLIINIWQKQLHSMRKEKKEKAKMFYVFFLEVKWENRKRK